MQEPDQYLLDLPELQERERPTLENFIVGENAEALAALSEMREGRGPKFLYLHGPKGAGLTHLLTAVDPESAERTQPVPGYVPGTKLYTVDDVDLLDTGYARQLFALQNAVYGDADARLICAGRLPSARLPLPDGVKSRLAWGLSYAVKTLSEEAAFEVLGRAAAMRGIELTPAMAAWMRTHLPRNMRALTRVFDLANQLALRTKRKVTLALVREAARVLTETGRGLD